MQLPGRTGRADHPLEWDDETGHTSEDGDIDAPLGRVLLLRNVLLVRKHPVRILVSRLAPGGGYGVAVIRYRGQ